MGRPCRTLITAAGWKLNLYDCGPGELYDLQADPHELENLWSGTGHRARIEAMTVQLQGWQAENGDRAAVVGI